MTPSALPNASARPLFAVSGFRFRPLRDVAALGITSVLMQAILSAGREGARTVFLNGPQAWENHVSIFLLIAICMQALLGLIAILFVRRLVPAFDANLRWPPERSYVPIALGIGAGMGLTMLVADYLPEMLSGAAFGTNYIASSFDIWGYLIGMATTGLAEETIFRGLLVGFLIVAIPGRVRIGPLDLPLAAYLVALLFAVAHYQSFLVNPLHQAIAQQLYAFAWRLVYVWLMERSRSLLAPIVAHGVGNFTEVAIVILFALSRT